MIEQYEMFGEKCFLPKDMNNGFVQRGDVNPSRISIALSRMALL
jgi:hypothetical protein